MLKKVQMKPAVNRLKVVAAGAVFVAGAFPTHAETTAGKAVFARCAICHSDKPGIKKLGPSLYGVLNRRIATAPGFGYSPAMTATRGKWDAKTLDAFLTDPTARIPGTSMTFAGLKSPSDRATIVSYLGTLK